MKKELLQAIDEEQFDSVVLYRLPYQTDNQIIIGNSEKIYNGINMHHCMDNGFVIEPFDNTKSYGLFINNLFSASFQQLSEAHTHKLTPHFSISSEESFLFEDDYDSYERSFEQMHQAIKSGKIDKVILSRIKCGPGVKHEQIIPLYNALEQKYPHAFVYVFSSPFSGTWIGAGPELLLQQRNNKLSTVSLAGTIPNSPGHSWSPKEYDEQEMVTNYIEHVLIHHQVDKIEYGHAETIDAGQVKHLCTTFNFEFEKLNGNQIGLLYDLHPTPAVCGMPKEESYQLILNTESHQRQFYSGFLGPVNNGHYQFYVNIRCMQVLQSKTALFVGGGLTKDSECKKEWHETKLKAQTLLSVLKNI
ncbi:chorismate-binding protein [Carboxylicivirga marina]|uniref:chorismate-binding protein n=1 Tax=Carboxylicivirga marina TaxID=2800988 RepID=UPI0025961214|nr:chorismate-binding protein [uncultured Carboxylicivirga sp.]